VAKALNGDKERMNKVMSRTPMANWAAIVYWDTALFSRSDASRYITGGVAGGRWQFDWVLA